MKIVLLYGSGIKDSTIFSISYPLSLTLEEGIGERGLYNTKHADYVV